jgi:hypothetical protein
MLLSISNAQIEFVQVQTDRASKAANQIIEILTSDKAQNVYRFILTAIALVSVVIVLGLSKAVKQYLFPVGAIVLAYGADKARQGVRWTRRQLAQWRESARRRMEIEWANSVPIVLFAWQGF